MSLSSLLKILLVLFFTVPCAFADDVYLTLSGAGKRADIAVDKFKVEPKNPENEKLAERVRSVLENDLILSRYFNIIPASAILDEDGLDRFANLSSLGATVVLEGSLTVTETDVSLKIKMVDVESRQMIWEDTYQNTLINYRLSAHRANNEIVRRFTGEAGIATTKIAFINNNTGFKELYIIDYDGHSIRRLTKDSKLNILPSWSPDGTQILYTSYLYKNPDLFILNLAKSRRKAISQFQGLNAAGAFSPDGQTILLTLSRGKYPNLYLINLQGEIERRLTDGRSIATSPSFAPNGREFVFISDAAGFPQLCIMNIDGGNLRRLPVTRNSDAPAWSPRGDKIAFAMRNDKGRYDICLYDLQTLKIVRLTNDQRSNENPTFSPDGRFLAFSSNRSGRWELYIMALDGSGTRKLAEIPGNSYTPSWSPYL